MGNVELQESFSQVRDSKRPSAPATLLPKELPPPCPVRAKGGLLAAARARKQRMAVSVLKLLNAMRAPKDTAYWGGDVGCVQGGSVLLWGPVACTAE